GRSRGGGRGRQRRSGRRPTRRRGAAQSRARRRRETRPFLQQDVQRRPGRHHASDRGHPVSRPTISEERYEQRILAAQEQLPAEDASALLVGVGPDLQWLTGYGAKELERLTMLVLPAVGRGTLIVPRLERAAAEAATAVEAKVVDVVTWEETEDPFALVAARLEQSNS